MVCPGVKLKKVFATLNKLPFLLCAVIGYVIIPDCVNVYYKFLVIQMNKDKRWLVQNDPGILRKKADAETDLFIFGYACKIFRDDQKALEMDQGKHLIPWMGDETLKVDRYDARGHLSEISQFEGTNQDYVLTAEERRIEQLCDEERYRALHHNEEEQEMYQEEELKRLKQALSSDKEYGQVAYQYETDGAPPTNSESDVNMEDGEPFVPSPSLCVPTNMKVPSTVKENQIIEKTAAHIASHGPQVEILIKTRQANNQKLNFLHVGSPLNPYYNFILTQIKTGRYKPGFMIEQEAESNQEDDHYLHPSLAAAPSATVESAPSIPSIAYKPSSDCFYNMLVNKIRHMQQSQVEGVGEREEPSTSVDSPPSRRKRRKRHSAQAQPATPVQKQVAVPPQHVKEIVSRLINFAHSRDLHPSEIAGDLVKQDKINLGFVEAGHKYHDYYLQQVQETYKENIYNLSNPTMEVVDTDEVNSFDPLNNTYDPERPTEEDVDVSGTENGDSPPLQEPSEVVSPPFENEQSVMPSDYDVPNQPTSKPAPVCFSIKKPKEAERLEVVSAFPLEETSSDEEGKEEKDLIVQPPEGEKEKPGEAEKLPTASPPAAVSDELVKTNEKERSVKNNKQSPTSSGSAEVIVMSSSQTSSEGSKSVSSSDSGKKTTSSSDSSRKSVSSSVSGKNSVSSTESGKKSTTPSEGSRKSLTSSDSSRKSTTSSEIRRKSLTSSESSRKSVTSNDSSRKSVTSNDSSRKSTSTEGSSRKSLTSIESRKSKERDREKRSHRKHKAALSCSPDKYRERDREKSKPLDEKSNLDPITKIRRESDDFPPFPEDPVASLTALPEENIEKKREERKKKVKEMIEKIKTESFGGVREENSQTILPAGAALTPAAPDGPLNVSKSFLPHGPNSLLSNKSNNKTEESKVDSQKDFEEQLREQVKLSLKKIAETALAAIPPINEDSCSQFEHSSAANSNGFETPTSCGRPMYRVSRTPSVGLMDGAMLEHSSSRSSSTVASRKSHKKKKHHKKKKKKRKGRSKSKKHHESSSESSSEDESSDEVWASSSDSDPRPKKRHKKSSKRSHKRHKRKHRRRKTSSSSSTSE